MQTYPILGSRRLLPGRPLRALGMLLLGGLLCAGAAIAQDDPPGRVGRIASLQGEVWVYEAEQGEWVAAQRNRPLTQGDRLSTEADSRVELRIGSTTLHLGGSAEFEAVRLDDERMQFALLRGSLGLRVRSHEVAAELEVISPEGRFLPLRSGLYRIDRQDETSSAGVWRGELQFQAPDLSRTLQPGQRAEFWRDGAQPITRSQWLAPLDDAFAQAVLRGDQADTRSAATTFVSPEMTGVEDLDRFGGWQQHPNYGAVWTPSTVVVGWVPYRYGQWIWLRPWGWTWVDDAPWGFAPFHYGRWLSWGGRWCWAPGPRVARPVYAPALVGWAGGPQFNVVRGSRPVPAVGWVPLAPREHYRPGYRASHGYLNRVNAHAQMLGPPPAGYGNRGIPGAVTVLPTARLAPRQPVAAAALRADEMVSARQWQAERFQADAPGRPAFAPRESARPRAAIPTTGMPAGQGTMPGAAGGMAAPWPAPGGRPSRATPTQPHAQGEAEARPNPSAQAPQTSQPAPAQPMQPMQPMQPAQPLQSVQPAPLPRPAATAPQPQPLQSVPPAQTPRSGAPVQAVTPAQPMVATAPAAQARPLPPAHPPAAQPVPQTMAQPAPAPALVPAPAPMQRERPGTPAAPAAPFAPAPAPAIPAPTAVARPVPAVPAAMPAARPTAPVGAPAAGGQAQASPAPAAAHKPFHPSAAPVMPAAAPQPAIATPALAAAPALPRPPAAPPAARAEPNNALGRDGEALERRRTPDSRFQQREK